MERGRVSWERKDLGRFTAGERGKTKDMVDKSHSSEDAVQTGDQGSGFKDMDRGFSLEKRGWVFRQKERAQLVKVKNNLQSIKKEVGRTEVQRPLIASENQEVLSS